MAMNTRLREYRIYAAIGLIGFFLGSLTNYLAGTVAILVLLALYAIEIKGFMDKLLEPKQRR